jgi:hypothetical protein
VILDKIKSSITNYVDRLDFDADFKIGGMEMIEVQSLAENIVRRPYQDWVYKEKTKIRHNFSDDAIRTWNRIKQSAGQATKIAPEIFEDHYSQNWEVRTAYIKIDENSDFIMQRRLVLTENDMLKELLNKAKMKEEIITENFEDINRNVIRTELNVIILRYLHDQYQTLYRTIYNPEQVKGEKYRSVMILVFRDSEQDFYLISEEH